MTDITWPTTRVLVTGACGTVGSELIRQLLDLGAAEVIGVDNAEGALFAQAEAYRDCERSRFALCDIRTGRGLAELCSGVDVLFHAAAYKHVSLCERSPMEAIETNVVGTSNVADAAIAARVSRVVFASSDKAVYPIGVMAATKLLAERVLSARGGSRAAEGVTLTSVRFGNVLGSSGSVIPIFASQIADGGPVTITDRQMTRFVMTVAEAAYLLIDAATLARAGETFVPKPLALRVEDLASVMIEELAGSHGYRPEDIDVEIIGLRPGEKLYEALMTEVEALRVVEYDRCLAFLADTDPTPPADAPAVQGAAHRSDQAEAMERDALRAYLIKNRLLPEVDGRRP